MSNITIETTLNVTETAKGQISQLIETNASKKDIPKDDLLLRIYVAGGGCSGVQFGMALTTESRTDDEIIAMSDFKIIVDPSSKPYVNDATIDFLDSDLGARFKITPSESMQSGGGCSCGAGGCC